MDGLATKEARQPVVTMILHRLSTTTICYANCTTAEFGWRLGRDCEKSNLAKAA